jgi:hypothetical protein
MDETLNQGRANCFACGKNETVLHQHEAVANFIGYHLGFSTGFWADSSRWNRRAVSV